ncbi:neutral/alkaline ceramidase [Chitinimonas sp. BJB300]|uniref:neutral/alkaline ceramidase n=1 Tax=Chitinimonas sp. BJB300 TaxID=1559339 RepID=UPI000C107229|nr:neutral/alkaline ceramidase [Chitinimonas sp. BJB300]PHV10604.1 alkaline ceramidase [Chitinimonas sp. BJB300]TSJ86077.1 alkaline ceramidase [Chitinimonas sp. BJB300]
MHKNATTLVRSSCLAASLLAIALPAQAGYLVGRGKADITGEAAEVGMMGYAKLAQKTSGIHLRQWARAFVVQDDASGRRLVFVNNDLGMVFQGVHQAVLARLKARFGDRYNRENVLLSATHTHAGPGGFSHYALYNFTTLGYNDRTFNAIVDGIVEAIVAADADLKPGEIRVARGELFEASTNRSLPAYERNPADERARWQHSIDPTMTVLRFSQGGRDVGMINWFATHGVSMHPSNTLISSDNKGYAAQYVEKQVFGKRGQKDFVAAFAQSNAGDMTPNDWLDGNGPTANEFDNTRMQGERQANRAMALFNGASELVSGPLDYRQQYANMAQINIRPEFGGGQTCTAALGRAFAAGTEDGRGEDGFNEGDLTSNPFLAKLGTVLFGAPADVEACQAPKPILITTGLQKPFPWTPEILPVSIARLGQLAIVAGPGEFTIMSGRRIRETVAATLNLPLANVIFAGYTNAYAGYVATPEEYDAQHYEGASTHFGRRTLPAYRQLFHDLAEAMNNGQSIVAGPTPRDIANQQISLQTGVVLDNVPLGKKFGQVVRDTAASYQRGQTAEAWFWTGHPKNNLRRGDSFISVEHWDGNAWQRVAGDDDWSTTYRWVRIDSIWGSSQARIQWQIPLDATPGQYRIVHNGDYKYGWNGQIYGLSGNSHSFIVN